LEATKTVTGFPPDALLMTSAYDNVDDVDLPGFLFVKSHFWDKGQPGVLVYLRRRTIAGNWIWLVSKAVSYVEEPIPGIIVVESLVQDEVVAERVNRITRITAILVQAVEASLLKTKDEVVPSNELNDHKPSAAPYLQEDTVAYQSLLDTIQTSGVSLPDTEESLRSLMQIAAMGGSDGGAAESKLEQELKENVTGAQKKTFDPWSMIESVRQGVRLDLGLTRLYAEEVKLVALVLTGKLPVNHVASLMLHALESGQSLSETFGSFQLDSEKSLSSNAALNLMHRSHHGSGAQTSRRTSHFNLPAPVTPPPISVVNLSYTYIGNGGMEMLAEVLYTQESALKTLDLSFCKIEEKGILSLARALAKRKRKGLAPLRGLLLSGNYISIRSAAELGFALAPSEEIKSKHRRKRSRLVPRKTANDSDCNESDDDEDDEQDDNFGSSPSSERKRSQPRKEVNKEDTALQVLHLATSSISAEAIGRLFEGLGSKSMIRELNLSSNKFGSKGASILVTFLESKTRSKADAPMPLLDRLDMSNNNLGDDGTTQLARAISKRSHVHLVDLKLSSNLIGAGGVETIMNKLLQHNLISLSLDKNSIGDQGCQLVAASLQSMTALSRLNLSFNQIGSRGITSLMRSMIGCESITYLGLSGNILRISGAIALAFTLAQHPRMEELDLDNCCLGQAAQCHISAGIISNRWVPMKRLRGYAVGPPMVAIGALKPYAQNLSNEECFRIRKDEQMKTILQWMENNRLVKRDGRGKLDPNLADAVGSNNQNRSFLTPDFVSTINDIHGTPSQNAYFRLLGWLSRIPFDDDELTALQKYFYDPDGGEGDRGSDGYINLKLRGDLLAALDSEVAGEIRDELPSLAPNLRGSVGIDLDKLYGDHSWDSWKAFVGEWADLPQVVVEVAEEEDEEKAEVKIETAQSIENDESLAMSDHCGIAAASSRTTLQHSKHSLARTESSVSAVGKERKLTKMKARITMFAQFEQQLEELKATAMEMIEQEDEPMQHQVILTQYAEASLTILRQLRYHCMNSGLDGWRHAGLKRKVLVIDDSNVTRKLVKRAFEKADFIVDTAADGAEGVEKLKQSIYDIAFMDIDMPIMNGFEATKKLREWEDKMRPGARQPICALTAAYVDDFERSELMKFKEAGLDVMESKPCNIPRLFKVVDDVSPMFSDLSINVLQRERSDSRLSDASGGRSDYEHMRTIS
jgi:CheY-like chemotaxis protein/Ran GTPase-activating protein (RanGAP) involved in mRNA processing and transport